MLFSLVFLSAGREAALPDFGNCLFISGLVPYIAPRIWSRKSRMILKETAGSENAYSVRLFSNTLLAFGTQSVTLPLQANLFNSTTDHCTLRVEIKIFSS